MDNPPGVEIWLSNIGTSLGLFLSFILRDFIRDKKFSEMREEQKQHFTCKFDEERKRHLSDLRDAVRDLRKDLDV